MENASKALAIAGSILLSIMIIATLLYMVNNIREVKNQEDEQLKQQQILEFNKEYESYEKNLMRGTDVITVINKANNSNLQNLDSGNDEIIEERHIVIKITINDAITDKSNNIIIPKNKTCVIDNYGIVDSKYRNIYNSDNKYKKFQKVDEAFNKMVNGQDANGNPDDSALKMFKRRFFKDKILLIIYMV